MVAHAAVLGIGGDVLVILGFLIIFLVFKENTFASATIELAPDQKVISTGPYAFVRHPMYAGGLVMLLGIPIALGSWWGLLLMAPLTPALIWRLIDEEKFLAKKPAGLSGIPENSAISSDAPDMVRRLPSLVLMAF